MVHCPASGGRSHWHDCREDDAILASGAIAVSVVVVVTIVQYSHSCSDSLRYIIHVFRPQDHMVRTVAHAHGRNLPVEMRLSSSLREPGSRAEWPSL